MSAWTWNLPLDPTSEVPLYQQIERAVVAALHDGRLRAGEALPSSRALAAALGVTRNTVTAALRELRAQGWLVARDRARMRVATTLPVHVAPLPAAGRVSLQAAPARPRWPLGAGHPDLRLIPAEPLARAMRRALRRRGGALLGYQDARGLPEYLAAVGAWLGATRGLAAGPDRLLSTRGAQHALDLLARSALRPGDRVAVEALGYPPAWRTFERAGATLIPLPVDADGLRVDLLEGLDVRAVYLTPHHQYPTTVPLSPPRRLHLQRLARARGLLVIEDDYDHEHHFDGRPLLPLAAADPEVAYIGTLSKVLAPGLRLGFLLGPPALIERAVEVRLHNDRHGDPILESAVAELVDDGELQRHLRRMRQVYRGRRDALVDALRRHLAGALDVDTPSGGIGLWARVHPDIDDEAWVRAAGARGVWLRPGRELSLVGARTPGLRMVFSGMDEGELEGAVGELARALPA
jgi:GntR family transcriptional regulator/MocR family aminotransferase